MHAPASTSLPPRRQRDARALLEHEWLLTNGLGGFAMGTMPGVNTRRYHGLLVAAVAPPVNRVVAVHSLVEQLQFGDRCVDLATQQFGTNLDLHPDGWQWLVDFQVEIPCRAVWTWRYKTTEVEREVVLDTSAHAVTVTYRIRSDRECVLRTRPLTPLRPFHELQHQPDNAADPFEVRSVDPQTIRIGSSPRLTLAVSPSAVWRYEPQWWTGLSYGEERQRGQDWQEDVWSPGVAEVKVYPGHEATLEFRATIEAPVPPGTGAPAPAPPTHVSTDERLAAAADQFVVACGADDQWSHSIIAGYPWFADWGRDTMISVPGLLLASGRFAEARRVLETFAASIRNGIIPNRFDDAAGPAHYNSVDAGLWFVHAAALLAEHDACPVHLVDTCRTIINAYRQGTDYGIFMDTDGLIAAGDETTQLTWMDARRDGIVFTPRHGKAVEINALWFNALHGLATMTGDDAERRDLSELADGVGAAFRSAFWWDQHNCCHDVLMPGGDVFVPDQKLRPNQVFAVSLPHSPLTGEQQRSVVAYLRASLLTPYGLRTLDPRDPGYRGRYEGDLFQRDQAYHCGTVWPWLIGPYAEAVLRVGGFGEDARVEVLACTQMLCSELDHGCYGQIAEVYDGDPPHRPSGCPAQAWSVAEVRRVRALAIKDAVRSG